MITRQFLFFTAMLAASIAAGAQQPTTLKDAYRGVFHVGAAINERQIAGTDWRLDPSGRLQPPLAAGRIHERQQLRGEERVEQAARREQAGEVVERDVVTGTRHERVSSGHRCLT